MSLFQSGTIWQGEKQWRTSCSRYIVTLSHRINLKSQRRAISKVCFSLTRASSVACVRWWGSPLHAVPGPTGSAPRGPPGSRMLCSELHLLDHIVFSVTSTPRKRSGRSAERWLLNASACYEHRALLLTAQNWSRGPNLTARGQG